MMSSESNGQTPADAGKASGGLVGAGLLAQIVSHLKDHPALLYGIAGVLLLLSVVGLTAGQPLLIILAVIVLLAGLAAWLVDSMSARTTVARMQPPPPEFDAEVEAGRDFEAGDEMTIASGEVPESGSFKAKVTFRDSVKFGDRGTIASSGPGRADRSERVAEPEAPQGPPTT